MPNEQEKTSKKQTGWASLMQVLGVGGSTESNPVAADPAPIADLVAEPVATLAEEISSDTAVEKKRTSKEPKVKREKEKESEKGKGKEKEDNGEKEKKRQGRFPKIELASSDTDIVDEAVSRFQREFGNPRQLAKAEKEDELKAAAKILATATAPKPRSKVTAKDPWTAIAAQLGVVATEPPILTSSVSSSDEISAADISPFLENAAVSTSSFSSVLPQTATISPSPSPSSSPSSSSETIPDVSVELSDDDIFADFAKATAQRRLKNVFNIAESEKSDKPNKPEESEKHEKSEKSKKLGNLEVAETTKPSEEPIPWEPKSSRPKSRTATSDSRTPAPAKNDVADTSRTSRDMAKDSRLVADVAPPFREDRKKPPEISEKPDHRVKTERPRREESPDSDVAVRVSRGNPRSSSDVSERVAPIYPERPSSERRYSERVTPTYSERQAQERVERQPSERQSSDRPSPERPSRGRTSRGGGGQFSDDTSPSVEPSQSPQLPQDVESLTLPNVIPTWNDAISTVRENNMERHLAKKRQPTGGSRSRR